MASVPYDRAVRCLDIAVDHRIRAHFLPILEKNERDEAGLHLAKIQELGKSLRGRSISDREIHVTKRLSGNCTGGIAVILLQPSNSHPYEKSMETIVNECPTYTAIGECFRAVTCETLSIRDVSILDSLPFIRNWDKITEDGRKKVREWAFRIIKAKRPDVILCMWQDKEGQTPEMSKIRSLGVGKQFDKSTVSFGDGMTVERVNAFHPSYAVNHNPSISCFRQLLLLEVTKACHLYESGWNEQTWMSGLRDTCRNKASSIRNENSIDLQYFAKSVGRHLSELESSILCLARPSSAFRTRDTNFYEKILEYNVTEKCNDVSLCIREISLWKTTVHPDDLTTDDETAFAHVVTKSLQFLRSIVSGIRRDRIVLRNYTPGTPGYYNSRGLTQILAPPVYSDRMVGTELLRAMQRFLQDLNISFEPGDRAGKYSICLDRLSELFVLLAEDVEDILGNLLEDRNSQQEGVDLLGKRFKRLGLVQSRG